MKTGVTYNSRRESNFICRMRSENREQYIKRWIAACNPEELIPYVEIVKHDKFYREIEYKINLPEKEPKQ